MDQLQCALLGYYGEAIRDTGVVGTACDALFSHPSEAALIDSAIPMAKDYEALSGFRERCAAGRVRGLYANALALGINDLLSLYEADVIALRGVQGVLALRSRYALTFRRVLVVLQCPDVAQRLKILHTVISEPRLPVDLRAAVGERVAIAMLRNVAHWCAHGEILDSVDFFVIPSDETEADGSSQLWNADRGRAPADWNDALLALIVVTGKERRQHLKSSTMASDASGHRELSELDRLRDRETARDVFNSIHDPALVDGGVISVDDLARRVRAAHARWTGLVWAAVKNTCRLADQLDAVRDMYLCRRGDLWQAFLERAGPGALFADGYFNSAYANSQPGAAEARAKTEQRCVQDAFRGAMHATGLADQDHYKGFALILRDASSSAAAAASDGGAPLTIDAIGAATLGRIRRLALQLRIPPGMAFVVSPNAQRRYVRLFALHIALKLSIFGLNEIRRFAGQVARSHQTSPLLRKVLHLAHTLNFFLSNVAFCLQGDVQDTQYRVLMKALQEATSVEAARRAHEVFMEDLYAGAFLLQDGVDVARAIDAAIMLALGLFVYVVRREATRSIIKAAAGSSAGTRRGGGPPIVAAETEVHRVLAYVRTQINRRILSPLPSTLSADTRPAHSALWTRLNFNQWFSDTCARLADDTPVDAPSSTGGTSSVGGPPSSSVAQPSFVPPPTSTSTSSRATAGVVPPTPAAPVGGLAASALAAVAQRRARLHASTAAAAYARPSAAGGAVPDSQQYEEDDDDVEV